MKWKGQKCIYVEKVLQEKGSSIFVYIAVKGWLDDGEEKSCSDNHTIKEPAIPVKWSC